MRRECDHRKVGRSGERVRERHRRSRCAAGDTWARRFLTLRALLFGGVRYAIVLTPLAEGQLPAQAGLHQNQRIGAPVYTAARASAEVNAVDNLLRSGSDLTGGRFAEPGSFVSRSRNG